MHPSPGRNIARFANHVPKIRQLYTRTRTCKYPDRRNSNIRDLCGASLVTVVLHTHTHTAPGVSWLLAIFVSFLGPFFPARVLEYCFSILVHTVHYTEGQVDLSLKLRCRLVVF